MMKLRGSRVISWILCMVMCIGLFPVSAGAASVSDSAQAARFGVTYSYSGKADKYYKLVVPSAGKLSISAVDTSASSIWFKLYTSSDVYNEYGFDYEVKSSVTNRIDYIDSYYLTPGTYYFGVINSSYPSSTPMNFQIQFTFESANESFSNPNGDDYMGTANPIMIGGSYRGMVCKLDEIDYYQVTIPSAGRIHWKSVGYGLEYYIYLYDAKGNRLTYTSVYRNSVTDRSEYEVAYNLKAGTYYFEIERYGSSGCYDFSTSFESANESFLDNGSDDTIYGANPIAINTSYNGQISKMMNDKDYYKYTVEAGKEYILNITAEFKFRWYIYDGNGKEYWYSTGDYNSALGQYTYSCRIPLSAGTYYLMIETEDGPGNYTFNYSEKPVESKPAKVGLKSLKSTGKKSLTVKWKKVSGATGYQIEITKPNGKKMKKRYVGAATAKLKVTGLKSKKKYKVRVRAYKITDAGTLYGKWSTVKKVKIK